LKGLAECNERCRDLGTKYFGLECPGIWGNNAVQCVCAKPSGLDRLATFHYTSSRQYFSKAHWWKEAWCTGEWTGRKQYVDQCRGPRLDASPPYAVDGYPFGASAGMALYAVANLTVEPFQKFAETEICSSYIAYGGYGFCDGYGDLDPALTSMPFVWNSVSTPMLTVADCQQACSDNEVCDAFSIPKIDPGVQGYETVPIQNLPQCCILYKGCVRGSGEASLVHEHDHYSMLDDTRRRQAEAEAEAIRQKAEEAARRRSEAEAQAKGACVDVLDSCVFSSRCVGEIYQADCKKTCNNCPEPVEWCTDFHQGCRSWALSGRCGEDVVKGLCPSSCKLGYFCTSEA